MGMAQLSRKRFVGVRAVWDQLVDPVLTLSVASSSNVIWECGFTIRKRVENAAVTGRGERIRADFLATPPEEVRNGCVG